MRLETKSPFSVNDDLLRPLQQTTWRFWIVVAALGAVVACGLSAWLVQLSRGFGLTGIRWPVFWGFYVTNFVFWIGISHAGTLISAILRLVNARWRRPVTRCAEVITVFALMIGAMFPIIHLGRPWLFFWLIPYPSTRQIWPNFRSPLVWDFFAIGTYLTGSTLFLLLPIIPDFALVRDRATGWRRRAYGLLALGWRGTTRQWHRLESAMQIMAIVIIPVAVSVHTIVSFDFSMAPVPMWHSTIFGPYFVAGAIFSGIAALIVAMALLRACLGLQAYLHPVHFENLGKLLLMMSLLWAYFIFAERLTTWYGNEPSEMAVFWSTQRGEYAPLYWTMIVCNLVVPFFILALKRLRTVAGCVVASVAVLAGMWIERFLIIVPSLGHKYLPYSWGGYRPRPVEIAITIATFAAMGLLYVLFSKFVPIISVWELKVGQAEHGKEKGERRREEGHRARDEGGTWNVEGGSVGQAGPIYALYPSPESAQQGVDALKGLVPEHDIVVISSEPYEEFEFSRPDKPTWLYWIAAAGGAAGLCAGYWLAVTTETRWPLPTGGMPIVAPWPNLIVMFELTMLGAIVATVIGLLISAGLPRRRPALYDPDVSEGRILVGIGNPPDASRETLTRALATRALAVDGPDA